MIGKFRRQVAACFLKASSASSRQKLFEAKTLYGQAMSEGERAEQAGKEAEKVQRESDLSRLLKGISSTASRRSEKLGKAAARLAGNARRQRTRARIITRIIAGKRKGT